MKLTTWVSPPCIASRFATYTGKDLLFKEQTFTFKSKSLLLKGKKVLYNTSHKGLIV